MPRYSAPTVGVKGPNGKARVNFQKSGNCKITFTEGDFIGQNFELPANCLPEAYGLKTVPNGEYFVKLNRDGSAIYSLAPIKGSFNVEFVRFAGKEGQPPAPVRQPNRFDPTKEDTEDFTALLRIVDGDLKGLELPYYMNYGMFSDGGDGFTTLKQGINGPYKGSEKINEFIGLFTGKDPETVQFRYSQNVLPALQEYLLANKRIVQAILKSNKKPGKASYIETLAETLQPKAAAKPKARK